MNEAMKHAVASAGISWSATVPLVLFVAFFVGVVAWSLWRSEPPPPVE
ncbi:hypothetical protein L6R50_06890 [Myxococcota bacterium]|nr:hypothetical protein [Myxococcota bacterium]